MKKLRWFLPLLAFALISSCVKSEQDAATNATEPEQVNEWAIVIHGGAGTIPKSTPDSVVKAYKQDLQHALSIGIEILENGGKAVDAVEQVIRYFEINPKFNAGLGAVYTHYGGHELDAAIMIGNKREAGAITGIKTVKHPITLARKVMEESKHVFLAGQGAEEFASKVGVKRVNNTYFDTEKRYKAWKEAIEEDKKDDQASLMFKETPNGWINNLGTVGCVVLDTHGTLVAGTSTGGMTDKMYGRVGDVPIIGSGTYASDIVAVSMTGWGEKIMKAVSGHTVSSYLRFNEGATLEEAGMYLLTDVLQPDEAGMIAVDKYGNTFMHSNYEGMFRGMATSSGERKVAIWND